MENFLWVLLGALLLLVGGLLRLLPGREERRLADLRLSARRRGLQVRRVTDEDRASLGLSGHCVWYLRQLDPQRPAAGRVVLARRREGEWCPEPGRGGGDSHDWPAGCSVLVLEPDSLAVAWDESGEEALGQLAGSLARLGADPAALITPARASGPAP